MQLDLASNLPVSVRLGEGNVDISSLSRSLQVEVEKANVRLSNIRSPKVRVKAGWGEVYVQLKAVPERIDIDVVVGNVVLEVPNALYHFDVEKDAEVSGQTSPDGIPVHIRTTSGKAKLKVAPG